MNEKKPDHPEDPDRTTPGRPKDSSRQQKHADQNVESGSDALDRRSAGDDSQHRSPQPPGAK